MPQRQSQPNIQALYQHSIGPGQVEGLGTLEEFTAGMGDPANRQAFHKAFGSRFELGSLEDFESAILPELPPPPPSAQREAGPGVGQPPSPLIDAIAEDETGWLEQAFGPWIEAGASVGVGIYESSAHFFDTNEAYSQAFEELHGVKEFEQFTGGYTEGDQKRFFGQIAEGLQAQADALRGSAMEESITSMALEGLGRAMVDIPLMAAMSLPGYMVFESVGEALRNKQNPAVSGAEGFAMGLVLSKIFQRAGMLPRTLRMAVGGIVFGGQSLAAELMKPPEQRDLRRVIADFWVGTGLMIPGGKGGRPKMLAAPTQKAVKDIESWAARSDAVKAFEKRASQIHTREGMAKLSHIEDVIKGTDPKAKELTSMIEAAKTLEAIASVESGKVRTLPKGKEGDLARVRRKELSLPADSKALSDVPLTPPEFRAARRRVKARAKGTGRIRPSRVEAVPAEPAKLTKLPARAEISVRKSQAGAVALRAQLTFEEQRASELLRRAEAKTAVKGRDDGMPGDLEIMAERHPDVVDALYAGRMTPAEAVTTYFEREGFLSETRSEGHLKAVRDDFIPKISSEIEGYLKSRERPSKLSEAEQINNEINFREMEESSLGVFGEFKLALTESVRAMHELLGGGRLGVKPVEFSEESFRRARPHLIRAASAYRHAGRSSKEFVDDMVSDLGEHVRPFFEKLLSEVDYYKLPPPTRSIEMPALLAEGSATGEDLEDPSERLELMQRYERNFVDKWNDVFGIQTRFIRIGSPETGVQSKMYYSTVARYEGGTLRAAEDLVGMGRRIVGRFKKLSLDEQADVVLFHESPKSFEKASPEVREKLGPAVEALEDFWAWGRDVYAEKGVKVNFKELLLKKLGERAAKAKEGKREEILDQMKEVRENFRYDHIPKWVWLNRKILTDPVRTTRMLKFLGDKKRYTFKIQDLIDEGLISKEDVNAVDIMASYGRRMGKDIALINILNAARSEGLDVSVETWAGWRKTNGGKVRMAQYGRPSVGGSITEGRMIHVTLNNFLYELANTRGMNPFEKVIALFKMNSFINPLYITMNDTYQMATMIGPGMLRSPALIARAARDVWKNSPERILALENGIESKPFNFPWESWESSVEAIKRSPWMKVIAALDNVKHTGIRIPEKNLRLIPKFIRPEVGESGEVIIGRKFLPTGALGTPWRMVKKAYEISFKLAWGGDGIMRQAGFIYLREQGMSPRDAAQTASWFFGAYDSIPPKTRKVFNHFFYTPTFRTAMIKTQSKMLKAAFDSKKWRGSFIGEDKVFAADTPEGRFARGLVYTMALMYAKDALLQNLGFERETWGYRYYRNVETPDGLERELVLTLPDPTNIVIRKLDQVIKATKEVGIKNRWLRWLNMQSWEFTPAAGYFLDITVHNRDRDTGRQLVYFFDSAPTKALKRATYVLYKVAPIISQFRDNPRDRKRRAAMQKSIGRLLTYVLEPFSFSYLRDPADIRAVRALGNIKSMLKDDIRNMHLEDKDIPMDHIGRALDEMEKALDYFDEFPEDVHN